MGRNLKKEGNEMPQEQSEGASGQKSKSNDCFSCAFAGRCNGSQCEAGHRQQTHEIRQAESRFYGQTTIPRSMR